MNRLNRVKKFLEWILILLFLIQVITGLLSAFYLLPSPETAYESFTRLHTRVTFGSLISEMHHWGAIFLIPLSMLYLYLFLFQGVTRKDFGKWVIGLFLLLIVLSLDLTGHLLPYTQCGYWTTTRSLEAIKFIPVWNYIVRFLTQSAEGVSEWTYIRFYLLHIMMLPISALILGFFGWRKGLFKLSPFRYPHYRLSEMFLILLAIIATFAAILPKGLGTPVDPLNPDPGATAVWYVRPYLNLAERTSRIFSGAIISILLISLFFLPLVSDTNRKKLTIAIGIAIGLIYIALSFLGG